MLLIIVCISKVGRNNTWKVCMYVGDCLRFTFIQSHITQTLELLNNVKKKEYDLDLGKTQQIKYPENLNIIAQRISYSTFCLFTDSKSLKRASNLAAIIV